MQCYFLLNHSSRIEVQINLEVSSAILSAKTLRPNIKIQNPLEIYNRSPKKLWLRKCEQGGENMPKS